jgi:hypothetical protein
VTEATAPVDAAEDWVIDRLYHEEPLPASPAPHLLDSGGADQRVDETGGADCVGGERAGVADVPAGGDSDVAGRGGDDDAPAADVNAGAKRTAAWLGVGVVAASAAIVGGFVLCSGGFHPSPPGAAASPSPAAAVSAAPRTTAAVAAPDQAIPFTASAPGCKGGSTSAQSLSDTAGDSAWVCVRGTPDEQVDGQVLHIDFTCDATRPASACSYLVNSVSVTPGSVAKTAGGQDDWLAHRVVTRLQYNFYNGDELAEILTQDTGNVHGPVAAAVRHPVLASHVVVITLQTSRPPASPLPTTNPDGAQPQPGSVDPGPGPGETTVPVSPSAVSDPVDATFAISALQFFGHQPN